MPSLEPSYESDPQPSAYARLIDAVINIDSFLGVHETPTRTVRSFTFQLHPEQYIELPSDIRGFIDPKAANTFTIDIIHDTNHDGVQMPRTAVSIEATARPGVILLADKLVAPEMHGAHTAVFVSSDGNDLEALGPISVGDCNRLVLSAINAHTEMDIDEHDMLDVQFTDGLVPALEKHSFQHSSSVSYEVPGSTIMSAHEGYDQTGVPTLTTVYLHDKHRKIDMNTTANFRLSLFEDDVPLHQPDQETIESFLDDMKDVVHLVTGGTPVEIATDPSEFEDYPDFK